MFISKTSLFMMHCYIAVNTMYPGTVYRLMAELSYPSATGRPKQLGFFVVYPSGVINHYLAPSQLFAVLSNQMTCLTNTAI